ncbi:GAF domain-containing protein, partial [Marinomonas sp. 42_23_T18]
CDSASESEIVLPIIVDGKLIGVLDIDSPVIARFDEEDQAGIACLLNTLILATGFKWQL